MSTWAQQRPSTIGQPDPTAKEGTDLGKEHSSLINIFMRLTGYRLSPVWLLALFFSKVRKTVPHQAKGIYAGRYSCIWTVLSSSRPPL